MSIMFVGDFAIPQNSKVNYSALGELFKSKIAIANLEGPILTKNEIAFFKNKYKYNLYTLYENLRILEDLRIKSVSLCNNHIFDFNIPIENTIKALQQNNISFFGLKNPDLLTFIHENKKVHIITFSTASTAHSLNIFRPKKVLKTIKSIRSLDKDCIIIIYPHWGYELNYYPEPADWLMAHQCIDNGADFIIGHHPHIVQQIEKYKGKLIFYSLGNFMLPQTNFAGKILKYKSDSVLKQIFLEIIDKNNIILHDIYFNKENNHFQILNRTSTEDCIFDSSTHHYFIYLQEYIHHTSWIQLVFRTRYTNTYYGEVISSFFNWVINIIRTIAIKTNIHNPFQNSL